MEVTRTLKPGDPGTKGFLRQYGQQLVAVRYRKDRAQMKRYTTIEIIVDEAPLLNNGRTTGPTLTRGDYLCPIHIDYHETELRDQVKAAGGRWQRKDKVWILRESLVIELGLYRRIDQKLMPTYNCIDLDM